MATEDFLPAAIDEQTVGNLTSCPKCGRPIGRVGDTLCQACFALLVNAAGKPVDPPKPFRMTEHRIIAAQDVEAAQAALPLLIARELDKLATSIPEGLVDDGGKGTAALWAQAREHGLLVMVVIQAAKPTAAAAPVVPRRA